MPACLNVATRSCCQHDSEHCNSALLSAVPSVTAKLLRWRVLSSLLGVLSKQTWSKLKENHPWLPLCSGCVKEGKFWYLQMFVRWDLIEIFFEMFGHESEAHERLGDLRLTLINSELKRVLRWVTARKVRFLYINCYSTYECICSDSWQKTGSSLLSVFLTLILEKLFDFLSNRKRAPVLEKKNNNSSFKVEKVVRFSRFKGCTMKSLLSADGSFKMKHLHQHQVRRASLLFACEAKSSFLNSPRDYVHCEKHWISASDIRQLLDRYNILICRQERLEVLCSYVEKIMLFVCICRNLTSYCKFQISKLL